MFLKALKENLKNVIVKLLFYTSVTETHMRVIKKASLLKNKYITMVVNKLFTIIQRGKIDNFASFGK